MKNHHLAAAQAPIQRSAAESSAQAVPATDLRPTTVAQRHTQQAISDSRQAATPVQLSRGSRQANKELQKSMGKSADFVPKKHMPKAKPHTKLGQGTSGTDHEGRNGAVINTAKQRTIQDTGNTTMFQHSQMRTNDARHREKDSQAEENRQEKRKNKKSSENQEIMELYGLTDESEITKDHRDEYRQQFA